MRTMIGWLFITAADVAYRVLGIDPITKPGLWFAGVVAMGGLVLCAIQDVKQILKEKT
jgi:hypothetical protein